jgi:hypothetical protein
MRTPNICEKVIERWNCISRKRKTDMGIHEAGAWLVLCLGNVAETSTRNTGEDPGVLAPAVIPAFWRLRQEDHLSSGVQDQPGNVMRPCIKEKTKKEMQLSFLD